MRIFPKSPWRVVALIVVGVALITWRLVRLIPPRHLYDYAGIYPDDEEITFDLNYAWLRERFGVDVRVILLSEARLADLRAFALEQARRLHVGDRESGQGLLVVINYATGQMRMEVGPRLEGTFTDAFTSYILRNHLAYLTDPRSVRTGLSSLWHLIEFRTLQSIEGDDFNPTTLQRVRDSTRLAAGAGATAGIVAEGTLGGRLPESVRRGLGPQPTPEALLDAYRRWVVLDPIDGQVGMFTERSRVMFENYPNSRPLQDIEFWKVYDRPYQFIVRDTLAIMFTASSAIIPPSLMVRSDSGWQFAVDVEWSHIGPQFDTPYTWAWEVLGDVFDSAFAGAFLPIEGKLVRLRDGNNRPLPVRKTRWE